VTAGRRRAGKDLDGFAIGAAVPAAVGSDRAVMLDGVRNELHRYFGLPFYRAMFEAAGYGKDLAGYDAAAPDREAQKRAISEEFIDSLCALGDVADVQRGIGRYRAAGVTNPVVTGVLGTDYAATIRAAAAAPARSE
jgi:hypothetical protein